MIEIINLKKNYGPVSALKGCSLTVPDREVFALLGPNGAGKTTLIKSLLNLISVDEGQIRINGMDCKCYCSRSEISYLPEKFTFYPYYSVEEVLKMVGRILLPVHSCQNMPGSFLGREEKGSVTTVNELVEKVLARLSITEIKNRKIKTLSKGQLQRVGLGQLLMSKSQIYILDEPFSGLDPIGIKDTKTIIADLKQQGFTVFINSHILSEMEQICDRIAILVEGQILAEGQVAKIKEKTSLEDYFYKMVTEKSN